MSEQKTQLKLNTKRTFLIGFAFFGILALWQIYYFYCPLFLDRLIPSSVPNRYTIIGVIMALDKILAILLIPFFGFLSDRTKTRFGRRMPYIVIGTIFAVMLFPFIAVMFIVHSLAGMITVMVLLIIAVHLYRAPSVALMPDITPKPLRAGANGIINIMGHIGVILGSIVTMFFLFITYPYTNRFRHFEFFGMQLGVEWSFIPFVFVSLLMLVAIIVLIFRFNEKRVVNEMAPDMAIGEQLSETIEPVTEGKRLGKTDRINFLIIFGGIALWFFAFNALNTWASKYGEEVLNNAPIGMAIAIMGIAGLATFLPAIKLSKKLGRKKSILIGIGMMIIPLIIGAFMTTLLPLIPLFAIAGSGWAIINLNSYVMLVEMASSKNVGRITGYYYIAQQGAQAVTSILAGAVIDWLGFRSLLPYAAVFMILAFILMLFFQTKKSSKSNEVKSVAAK